jgi:hypothetical protein
LSSLEHFHRLAGRLPGAGENPLSPLRKPEKGSRDECADAGSRKLIKASIKEEKRELAFGKNSK